MNTAALLDMTVTGALGVACLARLLCLWRLVLGPTVSDRILALDTLSVTAIAVLMLWGMQLDSTVYFEAALVIAMLVCALALVLARGALLDRVASGTIDPAAMAAVADAALAPLWSRLWLVLGLSALIALVAGLSGPATARLRSRIRGAPSS